MEEKEEIKVLHQPKASRVSPFSVISRNSSFDSLISGPSSSSEGSKGSNGAYVFDIPSYWSDFAADTNLEFPDAKAFSEATPLGDSNLLDDIFEEYQKLLDGGDPGERDSKFDFLS